MDPLQQQLAIFHQRAAMCKHLVGLYQIKLDHIQTLRCTITNGQVTTPTSEGVHIGTLALTCILLMFYKLISHILTTTPMEDNFTTILMLASLGLLVDLERQRWHCTQHAFNLARQHWR